MAAERIRVFIAGNIYVKRALVRRFLEDDGYEVVGEARTREDMVAAARREQPDAIVIDDELLARGPGGGTMGRVRRASPDAKVIVFTASPPEVASTPESADGYLEKGLGLASLTALLGRLFAASGAPALTGEIAAADVELMGLGTPGTTKIPVASVAAPVEDADDEPGTDERELVGAGVGAAIGDPTIDASAPKVPTGIARNRSGRGARTATLAAGSLLIVWGLVAMIASGGREPPTRALDRTDTTGDTVVEPPADEQGPLDQAYATLDGLIAALEGGSYVLATVNAQVLIDQRDQASAAGFALTGLDAEITARLEGLVGTLPVRITTTLAEILGSLYPTIAEDATQPGGGSEVVLGTTVTDPPPGDGDGRTGTSPDRAGGNGPGPGTGPGPEPTVPGPGDGKEWGQSHHPNGGWHGEKPDHHADKPDRPSKPGKPDHERTGPGKPPWAGP